MLAGLPLVVGLTGVTMLGEVLPQARLPGLDLASLRYVAMFLFYLALYTVVIFFNVALVVSTSQILDGAEPSTGHGLREAARRFWAVLGYAAISATVGVLLRMFEERLPFVNRLVVRIVGAAWAVTTFLVVPVLVHRDVGPVDAVKQSATMLRATWGENLIGNAGIGLVLNLLYTPLALFFAVSGIVLLAGRAEPTFGGADSFAIATVFWSSLAGIILLVLVHAALQGIYAAALYRHAAALDHHVVAEYFTPELVDGAFRTK